MKSRLLLPLLFTQSYAIDQTVDILASLSAESPLIKFDTNLYNQIQTSQTRSYHTFIILTALAKEFNCAPCAEFHRESNYFAKNDVGVFFGELDYKDGGEVFRELGVNSAPYALYIPPSSASNPKPAHKTYDFNAKGVKAEEFVAWVNRETGLALVVRRPIDWVKIGLVGGSTILGVFLVGLFWRYLRVIVESRKGWTVGSIGTIVLMSSGHMWNVIRTPPYAGRNEIFASGFSQQFVAESQAVGILYALIAVSFIALVTRVPTVKNETAQRIGVWACMGVFLGLLSVLLNVFKIKNGGYPFKIFL